MVKTGSEDLDKFLNEYNLITSIYGEAGSGKSTLCLLATIEQAINNKKVIFLDTEKNFSVERFEQLLNGRDKDCMKNILVLTIKNFNFQHTQIKNLENIKNVSLIVIDSLTHYYRRLQRREPELAKAMLAKQLTILKEISNRIPILVTSQVYSNMDNDVFPLGKELLKKYSNRIIKLEKSPRKIILEKENKSVNLEIINEGIKIIF